MRRATIRNRILAAGGILGFVATIVVFNLGCPFGSSDDPVASVFVSPSESLVLVGGTVQLTATVRNSSYQELDRAVSWSGGGTIASVSATGLVTGVSAGSATITATSGDKSGLARITVSDVPVATVTVAPPTVSLVVNGAQQLTATMKDAVGNVLTGRTVSWSGGGTIASVSAFGLVYAISPGGPVTITATSEGIPGSAQITVTGAPVATVTVSGAAEVRVGSNIVLTATLKDAASNVLTGRTVIWISLTPAFASVDNLGTVSGVSAGPATITATSEGKTGLRQITVLPFVNASFLTGRVINFVSGAGIGGATVNFLAVGGGQWGGTTSGADGSFTSPGTTTGIANGVFVEAIATGFVTGRILVASVPPGTTNAGDVPLVPTSSMSGGISGTVRNAVNAAGIAGATVLLFNNTQNAGSIDFRTSDGSGAFTFGSIPAGTYRLSASAPGFPTAAQRTGVAVGNGAVTSGQDLVLSPPGFHIVLTWDRPPSDLDSHLTGPNAAGTRFHVYYSSRGSLTADPFAFLDVDKTSVPGVETITITQLTSGTPYRYSVHDYSNRSSSTSSALGASGAKVLVYTAAGLVQTFFVPGQAGTLWTVFEITGTLASPVITALNTMGFATDAGGITSPPAVPVAAATDADLIGQAVRLHPKVPPR